MQEVDFITEVVSLLIEPSNSIWSKDKFQCLLNYMCVTCIYDMTFHTLAFDMGMNK